MKKTIQIQSVRSPSFWLQATLSAITAFAMIRHSMAAPPLLLTNFPCTMQSAVMGLASSLKEKGLVTDVITIDGEKGFSATGGAMADGHNIGSLNLKLSYKDARLCPSLQALGASWNKKQTAAPAYTLPTHSPELPIPNSSGFEVGNSADFMNEYLKHKDPLLYAKLQQQQASMYTDSPITLSAADQAKLNGMKSSYHAEIRASDIQIHRDVLAGNPGATTADATTTITSSVTPSNLVGTNAAPAGVVDQQTASPYLNSSTGQYSIVRNGTEYVFNGKPTEAQINQAVQANTASAPGLVGQSNMLVTNAGTTPVGDANNSNPGNVASVVRLPDGTTITTMNAQSGGNQGATGGTGTPGAPGQSSEIQQLREENENNNHANNIRAVDAREVSRDLQTEYKMKASGDGGEECGTGAGIDGRYDCSFAKGTVLAGQITQMTSQAGGAIATQVQGQNAFNNVVSGNGGMGSNITAQADLMEGAANTQKVMASVSLASGAMQMWAHFKTKAREKELREAAGDASNFMERKMTGYKDAASDGDAVRMAKQATLGTSSGEAGFIEKEEGAVAGSKEYVLNQLVDKTKTNFNDKRFSHRQTDYADDAAFKIHFDKETAEIEALKAQAAQNPSASMQALKRENALKLEQKKWEKDKEIRLAEMKLKATRSADAASAYAKRAAAEHKRIADQAMLAGITSLATGSAQLVDANQKLKTADSLRDMAKAYNAAVPGPQLTVGGGEQTEETFGGDGVIGGSADYQAATATEGNADEYLGLNPGGQDPFGTNDTDGGVTGAPAPGALSADGSAGGGSGGGGGGSGAGGGGGAFAPPPAAVAGGAKSQPKLETEFGKGGAAYAQTGGGSRGGGESDEGNPLSDLMAKMMGGGAPDNADKSILDFGGRRNPASDDAVLYDPSEDIFKKVGERYRAKNQQGSVGVVARK